MRRQAQENEDEMLIYPLHFLTIFTLLNEDYTVGDDCIPGYNHDGCNKGQDFEKNALVCALMV